MACSVARGRRANGFYRRRALCDFSAGGYAAPPHAGSRAHTIHTTGVPLLLLPLLLLKLLLPLSVLLLLLLLERKPR